MLQDALGCNEELPNDFKPRVSVARLVLGRKLCSSMNGGLRQEDRLEIVHGVRRKVEA